MLRALHVQVAGSTVGVRPRGRLLHSSELLVDAGKGRRCCSFWNSTPGHLTCRDAPHDLDALVLQLSRHNRDDGDNTGADGA